MGRPKKFNRAEVLDKAIPLFWVRGFADTSLQDLEKATGVNKSGLYSEFESKEDIYLASLRRYAENCAGKAILAVEPLGWGNVKSFLEGSQACVWGQSGCLAVNSLREIAILPSGAHEIIGENVAVLKSLLVRNIQVEQTSMPPDAVADIVLTFFSGLCLEQGLNLGKAILSRKIEDLMHALRSL